MREKELNRFKEKIKKREKKWLWSKLKEKEDRNIMK